MVYTELQSTLMFVDKRMAVAVICENNRHTFIQHLHIIHFLSENNTLSNKLAIKNSSISFMAVVHPANRYL